ncbi:MAG TPA: hypothetical protein VFC18_12520 [Burkholderiales bacterium]|nr:hypothetical protein [Burkholderiales bacterium]
MEDKELLRDIKALLEEQNRLIADLKRQYEAMAARNVAHMTHSHVRFWIVAAGLLLLLLFPNILAK